MSYLAVPALLEAGLIREALGVLRAVTNFHQGAGTDAGDMLYKACKMANYDQVLEIKKFGVRLARSMQLALARSEFPLLELAESRHTRADAVAYLKLHRAGMLPESLSDGDREVAAAAEDYYYDNMDYDVLPPSCSRQCAREKGREGAVRRAAYLRRLAVFRGASDVALRLMQLDPAGAIQEAVEALRRAVVPVPAPETEAGTEAFSVLSTSAASCGPNGFEQQLWGAVCDVAAFSAECLRLATETGVVSEQGGRMDGDECTAWRAAREAALGSMRAVREMLLGGAVAMFLPAAGGGAAPLSPAWVRMASAFCLTLGSLAPLMLETLTEPLVHSESKANIKPLVSSGAAKSTKKKGPKKGPAAVEGEEAPDGVLRIDTVIEEVAAEMNALLDGMLQTLRTAKKSLTETNLKHFMDKWKPACKDDAMLKSSICNMDILFDENVTFSASGDAESSVAAIKDTVEANLKSLLSRSRATIITDIVTSQETTCTRLHETLEKKHSHFKIVFPMKKT
jgi:hypothetical protein